MCLWIIPFHKIHHVQLSQPLLPHHSPTRRPTPLILLTLPGLVRVVTTPTAQVSCYQNAPNVTEK